MDVKTILLGFLMYGSMTGYELKKFFSISFSFFSGLSYGSIYPALRKMEQEGLIAMRLEVQDGAPNRKIYTITDLGKKAFAKALETPFRFERVKNPFLTRLFFFAHLSKEARMNAAVGYLESVKQVQEELEAARSKIETHADYYQYLSFQFGVRFFQDLVRNISEIVDSLENEGKDRKK
jgi:DNA-binding PadR family transcriptional regulator